MQPNAYLTFLVLGAILVVLDGQIIYWSGRRYLGESAGDAAAPTSMTRLAVVLFHLVTLGLLALISTINFGGGNDEEAVAVRLGVVLLLLAAAHAATMGVLSRIRDRQESELLTRVATERRADRQVDPMTYPAAEPGHAQPVPSTVVENQRFQTAETPPPRPARPS